MTRVATPDPVPDRAWSSMRAVALLLALLVPIGMLIIWDTERPGGTQVPETMSVFFVQYRAHEWLFAPMLAAFAIAAAVLVRRSLLAGRTRWAPSELTASWGPWQLAMVALAVFGLSAVGNGLVMHSFPLAMDEYVAWFQARLLAAGQLKAVVPDDWRFVGEALTPVYVGHDRERHEWISMYLPVYSALKALFLSLRADRFLNPALAAASIGLVYACARRLWPADVSRAWLAVGFLALSSQFLFMSMAGYSMPAHLCLNVLWLYAYLREDRMGWLATPVIGVAAMGLHNAVPHALFVAPFLVHLVLRRRWGWTCYFAVIYLAGAALWLWWLRSVVGWMSDSTIWAVFALPGSFSLMIQTLSFSMLLTWQTPVLAVVLLWLVNARRDLSEMERYLAAGVLLSFLFFFLFPRPQGHGWGYRYTYPVLGNMVLLGATGVTLMAKSVGTTARRLLFASALLTVFVQWPVRAWQIEQFVRPFAQLHEYIATLDADVVIVDPTTSFYGIDLVRNDPFLEHRPKVLSALWLGPQHKRALAERFGDRVHLLAADEIAPFGIPTYPSLLKPPVWPIE